MAETLVCILILEVTDHPHSSALGFLHSVLTLENFSRLPIVLLNDAL